ncbi:MAG: hypothetical protein Q4G51_12970, partial [Dermatophilus congolensis]|nr:hypothetical protein [Dermatophilus congolensis]
MRRDAVGRHRYEYWRDGLHLRRAKVAAALCALVFSATAVPALGEQNTTDPTWVWGDLGPETDYDWGAQSPQSTIEGAWPISKISIGQDLNCGVWRHGETMGQFFEDFACGTWFVTDASTDGSTGVLHGPGYVPADGLGSPAGVAKPRNVWVPVSQTTTGTSPITITTQARTIDGAFTLTQRDIYAPGADSYRTTFAITNNADPAATPTPPIAEPVRVSCRFYAGRFSCVR